MSIGACVAIVFGAATALSICTTVCCVCWALVNGTSSQKRTAYRAPPLGCETVSELVVMLRLHNAFYSAETEGDLTDDSEEALRCEDRGRAFSTDTPSIGLQKS